MASLSWEIVDGLFNVVEKEEMVREHCCFNLDVSVDSREKVERGRRDSNTSTCGDGKQSESDIHVCEDRMK